jgi:hypothetical protein
MITEKVVTFARDFDTISARVAQVLTWNEEAGQ